MPHYQHNREYDVVLLGATGYTGRETIKYIVKNFPSTLKWAIAGRNPTSLQTLWESTIALDSTREPPIIEIIEPLTQSHSNPSLLALTTKTRLLFSCSGPYHKYGPAVFAHCAESGTHYLDVSGELVYNRAMGLKYEATAAKTGAILIPQCGIESSPVDISVFALCQAVQSELSTRPGPVTTAMKISGSPSGGTLATVFSLMESYNLATVKKAFTPYSWSPVPRPNPPIHPFGPTTSALTRLIGIRNVPGLGLLTTAVAGRTDAGLVERSWGLIQQTSSLKQYSYGDDFSFVALYRTPTILRGILIHFFALAMGIVMAVPVLRNTARKYVVQPGDGASEEDAKKENISYDGIAIPSPDNGKRVKSHVEYSGPMYYLTGLLAMEAGRVLLEDDHKLPGGVYTPACLGNAYISRLSESGFKIDISVVDS